MLPALVFLAVATALLLYLVYVLLRPEQF